MKIIMAKSWNVLNWNVRGLNDKSKWLAIRNKIEESNCAIICLQETKRETIDLHYIRNFCPKRFSNFEYLPSVGASGGLLIAWNESIFSGQLEFSNEFSISVKLSSVHNNESWYLTNVYGPCESARKTAFINWFQNISMPDDVDWLVLGDFNYIRYPDNRNKEGGSFSDMNDFNAAISALALVEIPLKDRVYTWSNMQHAPLLEKLDWIFSSESWTLKYPSTLAYSLAKPLSDHVPYVVQIQTDIPKSTLFMFEDFWLLHPSFKDTVKSIWAQNVSEPNSAKRISAKFKRLRKGLKLWAKSISNLTATIKSTNEAIIFFDTL